MLLSIRVVYVNKNDGNVMCDRRICLQCLEINESLIVLCKSGFKVPECHVQDYVRK